MNSALIGFGDFPQYLVQVNILMVLFTLCNNCYGSSYLYIARKLEKLGTMLNYLVFLQLHLDCKIELEKEAQSQTASVCFHASRCPWRERQFLGQWFTGKWQQVVIPLSEEHTTQSWPFLRNEKGTKLWGYWMCMWIKTDWKQLSYKEYTKI